MPEANEATGTGTTIGKVNALSDETRLSTAVCPESESGYSTTTHYGEFWRYPLGVEALSTSTSGGKHLSRSVDFVNDMEYGVWRRETCSIALDLK
ncbi:uncharacterized protein P174DRAFT_248890 [Aspergillus novofumigatus IBT 16806]|uniref:Uncharacterized protein n=1 Tax=Aspergillus novofumigatus (strain IBT 16806) TaxID=1392255 RepID=A0A2I1C2E4_ASPN1|nr:uncharacterized protein P174DRAFT_248890 [Aspergillus novofumigatus IBT 16806]PKX91792.1 hypothetical protein P174DRAFT_248890 [Aspergillus novofumigatus IBT 16806]